MAAFGLAAEPPGPGAEPRWAPASGTKRGWPRSGGSASRTRKMRHGRKSKAVRFDADKRHAATLRGER